MNDNTCVLKISDLGFNVTHHASHSIIGTTQCMDPSLYGEDYNQHVDVYSFGMFLLEMVTLDIPYSEGHNVA